MVSNKIVHHPVEGTAQGLSSFYLTKLDTTNDLLASEVGLLAIAQVSVCIAYDVLW